MTPVEGMVWCDEHGDVHAANEHPYSGCPTEVRDGREVWLMYQTFDKNGEPVERTAVLPGDVEKMVEMEPECTAASWKKLWVGASYEG
jgi:hypothetical protein